MRKEIIKSIERKQERLVFIGIDHLKSKLHNIHQVLVLVLGVQRLMLDLFLTQCGRWDDRSLFVEGFEMCV